MYDVPLIKILNLRIKFHTEQGIVCCGRCANVLESKGICTLRSKGQGQGD